MSKPKLYLLVGYPGSGKTTVARIIHDLTGAVHIWSDWERQAMFENPSHSREESLKLYAYLNTMAGQLLHDGQSVIFDTNFNFRKDRDHLREIAKQNGAEASIIWVTTNKELSRQRAVHESHGQETRLYGNMTDDDFDRIASHLEAPDKNEKVIKIEAVDVDEATVKRLLNL